jgi:hypothetical protein
VKQGSVLAIICLLGLTGCSITGENLFASEETGRFTLNADAEGLRAFGEAMNGLVVTGKAMPNQGDSYFITQQQRVEAKRFKMVNPYQKVK